MFPNRFLFDDLLRAFPDHIWGQRRVLWQEWVTNADLDDIEEQVLLLRDTQERWEKAITRSLEQIDKALPGLSVEIFVLISPPLQSEGGIALGPNKVGIFWPDVSSLLADRLTLLRIFSQWHNCLPALVAHEIHHSVRFSRAVGGGTLGEWLVTEGLAKAFAWELYPELQAQCTYEVTPAEERLLWEEMLPELETTDLALFNRYFFGDFDVPYGELLERTPRRDGGEPGRPARPRVAGGIRVRSLTSQLSKKIPSRIPHLTSLRDYGTCDSGLCSWQT